MTINVPPSNDSGKKDWFGRRQLVWQVGTYLIVNALFVGIWASGGSHRGFFWPLWTILFWGIAVAFFALRSLTSSSNSNSS